MTQQQARINGQIIPIHEHETIVQAAHRAGFMIPTCCYHEGLPAEGGCRICMVEVIGQKRLVGACHTQIQSGMEILTHTPKLEELRREILSLTQVALDKTPGTKQSTTFNRLISEYLPDAGLLDADKAAYKTIDDSHPYIRMRMDRCIKCRLCLNVCEQIQGQFVYSFKDRGGQSQLIFGPTDRFADSPCVACGACVEVCPTGAITDRDRINAGPIDAVTATVCGYCGVGCRLEVSSAGGKVKQISGVESAAVNRGHLCLKGRYAHTFHDAADRLTQPLRREGDHFTPITWSQAYEYIAEEFQRIKATFGADALGAFTSSRSTNESAYLLQKLFRTEIGTNNVDCCARVCHSSTATALQLLTGTGAATASYHDIEKARCIVVAGANPTDAHPVVGARIKQAALRGVPLITIDPRRIELADFASLHLQLLPGTNVPLFNALAKILVEKNLINSAYIQERLEGYDDFTHFIRGISLTHIATLTGVDVESMEQAATMIGQSGTALFVSGLGLSELTQGVSSVMSYTNLGMLTGSIGRPGAGMLPLRGQNNVQGNADMGAMPNQFTGYQSLQDPAVRDRVQKIWHKLPPTIPGLTIPEMLEGAEKGLIRALWIQGEDVAQSDPNETQVRRALSHLDFLVVQELFFSETARYAHVILPAASFLEQDGTFTNGERRIQRVRPAVLSPGQARPDWLAVRDIAVQMGAAWHYESPRDVMQEIAQLAPHLFGGVDYSRLHGDGLQWPCPSMQHPGTATVHEHEFIRGKGKLVGIDYIPSPEHGISDYPLLLITGRLLEHYNVGTMTRRTPNINLSPEDILLIHPADAVKYNIGDGFKAKIESRWGSIVVKTQFSRRLSPGTLFLTFHYPETHANALTGPHGDPVSHCPQYKAIAVRLVSDKPAT